MHRAALALLPLLAACSAQARDGLARETAEAAITPVVAERIRGVPTTKAVRCILDNADRSQVNALAADNVQGRTGIADDIVTDVLFRDGTRECFRRWGIVTALSKVLA